MKREKSVLLMLTPDEMELLADLAQKNFRTKPDYLRSLIWRESELLPPVKWHVPKEEKQKPQIVVRDLKPDDSVFALFFDQRPIYELLKRAGLKTVGELVNYVDHHLDPGPPPHITGLRRVGLITTKEILKRLEMFNLFTLKDYEEDQ